MDKCWLEKKVKGFDGFVIDQVDDITKQISREIKLLFDNCKENHSNGKRIIKFKIQNDTDLIKDGFKIINKNEIIEIIGKNTMGLLYGLYTLYRREILKNKYEEIISNPDQSIRMINHWDNMDGTIERGYAGESIFFKDNSFRRDFTLVEEYARLLASVGINALSINNVNVHKIETELITEKFLPELVILNQIFNRFGIKMFLSINFASPKRVGNLDTSDPLDENVIHLERSN